jgi:hypothetical protein
MASERQASLSRAELRAAEQVEQRLEARRLRLLRIVGTVLVIYGVAGLLLFSAVAWAVGQPLDEAGRLTVEIEGQRGAALEALDQATITIEDAAAGVRGMDSSLAQANDATQRAATLSVGVAASMRELSNAMRMTIFGVQPLVGLAPAFEQTGEQLELLGQDLLAIGSALEANREDARSVAGSLERLRQAVELLNEGVRDGPRLEVSSEALEGMRLGIYAVIAWMLALALGCVVGGLACLAAARR